jgi:hypothetical protein
VVNILFMSIQEFDSSNLDTRQIYGISKAEAGFTGRLKQEKGKRAGVAGLGQIYPRSRSAAREPTV